ncbi:sigma-54-dependent Fis family transcriptional regulator [Shewanella ulleungensis]|uniref:Sigma-54-dependent Fis family transcriptional regulator n=2 Tax=Shewanella ulleungensis TaxID=2282699 RepID=A0ABQ2QEG6_9GAMM|nr:sigma-54-dependent Fis family transcriptional regulator [Shewanella ulleungensis]MCL1148941.1 sigma-54-dependent Fis family transcriptional regulator [Shewanella ulleungensis]GGP74647.1 sigma-54-dependent Fis family transcriptional regulator [Shewanella ulleungensis]
MKNTTVVQSMINAIDKPAIFITPDYIIHAVNQAYIETYDTQVTLGKSRCHEISHHSNEPCDKHGEECPLQQCQNTARAANAVHIHSTAQGKSYCDILMKPIKDDNGIIMGFLEILDSIDYASTESKKDAMVGQSVPFKQMLNKINRASQSNIAVLLQGETGSGKELVAKAVHQASNRSDKPFVVIECTGLSENLFESELFGFEKGAFTGATTSKKGLIEIAHGGTVFFDEIGDVPMNMQVKLLRLLETQCYRAVGGLKQKRSDFRLVSASHKNLLELVDKGEFRRDLYYRIAGFPIYLPSLRERQDDIPTLINHFIKLSDYKHKKFSANALQLLSHYTFPGNIRELKNIIEQSALIANEDLIHSSDLPESVNATTSKTATQSTTDFEANTANLIETKMMSLDEIESEYLAQVCQQFTGSPAELAIVLNVSVRTLYRKLQRYGLKLNDK